MEALFAIKTIILIINAIGIWLAFLVNIHRPKSRLAFLFTAMVFLMFIWVNFAYLTRITDPLYGLSFIKLAWSITPFFFVLIYLFIKEFLARKSRLFEKILVVIGIVNIPIVFFSSLVIKNIWHDEHGILQIIYGGGEWVFFGEVFLLTIMSFYTLFKRYIETLSREEKTRIIYLLVGLSFFFLMNAVFNIVSPVFLKIFHLYEFGDYSTIVFLSFVTYAVIEKRLFGIKVFLTEILVGVVAVLLLINVFTSKTFFEYIWKGALFITFLFFSYFLIKSVQKEVKLKEEAMSLAGKEKTLRQDTEGLAKRETALRQRAERLLAAEEQFLLAIQHHLRTPLTGARNYIDELEKESYGKLPSLAKEKVKKANLALRILIHLVNDIIDISKMSLGQEILGFQDNVQLEEVIGEVIQEQKLQAETKELYLRFEKPKEPLPKMRLDPERLKESVYNLVDNGLKYTPESKGGVTISLDKVKMKEQDYVQISISDTGIGLTPEEKETVLTFFFERGETARKMWGVGKGVGLYISNQFIKAHSGEIKVESEGRDKGSTFYIYLPINPEKNEKNEKAKNSFH